MVTFKARIKVLSEEKWRRSWGITTNWYKSQEGNNNTIESPKARLMALKSCHNSKRYAVLAANNKSHSHSLNLIQKRELAQWLVEVKILICEILAIWKSGYRQKMHSRNIRMRKGLGTNTNSLEVNKTWEDEISTRLVCRIMWLKLP